ncbi:MAG: sulfur carrier protein ThiS [Candidatus Acidiferrales bacterium]
MSGATEGQGQRANPTEIEITVNGELKNVSAGLSIPRLLDHLGIRVDRVAIERNLTILPKVQWQGTVVESGDRFEIVHFVGGG